MDRDILENKIKELTAMSHKLRRKLWAIDENTCWRNIVTMKLKEIRDEIARIKITLDTLYTYDLCGTSRCVQEKDSFEMPKVAVRTHSERIKNASKRCLWLETTFNTK